MDHAAAPRFSIVLLVAEQMTRQFPLRWLRIALCRDLMEAGISVTGLLVDEAPAARERSEDALVRKHGEEAFREFRAFQEADGAVSEVPSSYQRACDELGIPFHRVDLNSDVARAIIRDLAPDVGLMFGCRILEEATLEVPRLGTLNFHGRDAEVYRGGGALGYWELLEGEQAVQITIHKAVAKVDAGAILATERIAIEPCDTLESLLLKILMKGLQVYTRAVVDLASGQVAFRPQRSDGSRTYRRDLVQETLFRRDRRRVLLDMPRYASADPVVEGVLQDPRDSFLGPSLSAPAPDLEALGDGAVLVLAWPAIINDASHPLNLPLEVFYAQVAWLSRFLSIVSLAEAQRRLDSGEPQAPCVVLSLDGGFQHDRVATLPFLVALGAPFSLFVPVRSAARGDSLCGRPLLREGEIRELANSPLVSFGLLSETHFEVSLAQGRPIPGEDFATLEAWTGRPAVAAALPLADSAVLAPDTLPDSKLILDADGSWNRRGDFDGRRMHRVPAPSSVEALAALFPGAAVQKASGPSS